MMFGLIFGDHLIFHPARHTSIWLVSVICIDPINGCGHLPAKIKAFFPVGPKRQVEYKRSAKAKGYASTGLQLCFLHPECWGRSVSSHVSLPFCYGMSVQFEHISACHQWHLNHSGKHKGSAQIALFQGNHCYNVLGHLDYEKWYHLQEHWAFDSEMQSCFQKKKICSSYSKSKSTTSSTFRSMARRLCVTLAIFFLTFYVSWTWTCICLYLNW